MMVMWLQKRQKLVMPFSAGLDQGDGGGRGGGLEPDGEEDHLPVGVGAGDASASSGE